MSDGNDEGTLEVIKLRIDFLKHMTTLSGAATVIVLALIQRIQRLEDAPLMAAPVVLFGLDAMLSLYGMVKLINLMEEDAGNLPPFAGSSMIVWVGTTFAAGVTILIVTVFARALPLTMISVTVLSTVAVVFYVTFRSLFRRRRGSGQGPSDE